MQLIIKKSLNKIYLILSYIFQNNYHNNSINGEKVLKNLKEKKSYFKLDENKISIIFIILFSSLITVLLIWINSSQEILGHSYRDIYFYLIQGLRFTGYQIGGYEYVNYLSPLIPFLSSILFKLGFINETSIFISTGLFYPLSVLGIYLLLKLRFNNLISVFGSILYCGFSINLMWAANGTIDIPSVSLSIWAIYFMILAIDKNQKYFYLAFPIAVLAFFAKYTAGLIFPLMILYFFFKPNIKRNIKEYLKNGFGGFLTGVITIVPFFAYFYFNDIPLGFINQANDIASTTTGTINQINTLNNNLFYYFTNLPRFIYNPNHILSWFILAIGLIGLLIIIYKSFKLLKNRYDNSNKFNNDKFKIANITIPSNVYYFLLILNIIIIGISFLTASKISFISSEALFFISILSFSFLMNKIMNIYSSQSQKDFRYDLLMFSWFFSYMIFFSAHLTKVDRYFTTMAPFFAYFISLSVCLILNLKIDSLQKYLKKKIKGISVKNLIPIAIIIVLLISSFGYLTIDKHDPIVHDEKEIAKWLNNYDVNHQSKVIWAERGPIFTWYLKKDVEYVNWLSTPEKLSNEMVKNNVSYYISIHPGVEIPHYSPIKRIGEVTVYKLIDNKTK